MKLFVWRNVLQDYTDGIIFAMAPDLETAKSVILSNFTIEWQIGNLKYVFDNKEPEVYDEPFGYAIWGGG